MKRANIICQYEKQSVNVTLHPHTFVHPTKEIFLWPPKLKKLTEKVKKKKGCVTFLHLYEKKKHLSKCCVRIAWSFKWSFFFNKENIFIISENVSLSSYQQSSQQCLGSLVPRDPGCQWWTFVLYQRKQHRDEELRQHGLKTFCL